MAETNKDDFWDLSSLVPKKRPPVQRRERDVETVEIEFGAPEVTRTETQRGRGSLSARFREVTGANVNINANVNIDRNININVNMTGSSGGGADIDIDIDNDTDTDADRLRLPRRESVSRTSRPTAEPILEYEPEHGLIKRVRVMQWPSRYSFYEQFRFDAKRYADVKGHECEKVDFFSYTPQYRQMSKAQLSYYLWWRENARAGVWLPASFSYVLLYVYEIINLRGVVAPEDGVRSLCAVWLAYREKDKVLDKYLSEWVADYCLINRLPAPLEQLAPILPAVLEAATLKEFYMSGDGGSIGAGSWMDLSSDYHWQKSKFALEEATADEYKRHMPGAVGYVIERRGDMLSRGSMREAVVSRDAFCGSLCAHNVKCRIDIEYLSYVRSRELRSTATELVKYAENKLRSCLGIKARLRVGELAPDLALLVDEYFAREFPTQFYRTKKSTRTDGENSDDIVFGGDYDGSMYEALSAGMDAESAAEIERASWASTELLTDTEVGKKVVEDVEDSVAGEGEAEDAAADSVKAAETEINGDVSGEGLYSRLDGDAAGFLRLVLAGAGADAQGEYCRERGIYADEVAARINDAATETDEIGDIVLEVGGDGGYAVIEDYRQDLE